jgi:hypothetical protein
VSATLLAHRPGPEPAADSVRSDPRPLPAVLRWRPLLAASSAIAAISLIFFRTPTFDVWAWLLWGREAAHLTMSTTWGPAFKPLPVAVTTVLSPLGDAAPVVWLFLARLGGLLAVAAAGRLAYRTGGAFAAVVAAVGLLMSRQYVGYLLPHGMSEPMMVAFLLWALDRACDGRREVAFWLGVCGGLLRPEIWPFLLGWAIVLARRPARAGAQTQAVRKRFRLLLSLRLRLASGLLLLPVAWYLPDYLASGEPFRAGEGVPVPGGPLTEPVPGLAVVHQVVDDVPRFVLVGAVLGVAVALVHAFGATSGRHRSRLLGLVGLAAGWITVVALMPPAGRSTGVSRYALPTYALMAVLAGVGWATVLGGLVRWARTERTLVPLVVSGLAVLVGVATVISSAAVSVRASKDEVAELRYQAGLERALPRAIDAAGGPDLIRSCGQIWTSQYQVTFVAWELDVPIRTVWSLQLPGLPEPAYVGPLLQTKDRRDAQEAPVPFDFLRYRTGGGATADGATWTIQLPADCS